MTTTKIHTCEDWQETIEAMHSGQVIEIDEEVFDYFLEVLPPVHMGYLATIPNDVSGDGTLQVHAAFGFAEGLEHVTAFWYGHGLQKGKYFCCRTKEINPHA